MQIKEIINILENFAPLSLQEDFDNSGLQIGDISCEMRGILVCLDVTEQVLDEAFERDCNLIISHHPLLFKPLRMISKNTYIGRCVTKACKLNLVIYSAHTNLDNACEGVNFYLAKKIGLRNIRFLQTKVIGGSGAIGELDIPENEELFLNRIKSVLQLPCLQHSSHIGKKILKVALCGGSGAFLIPDAIKVGANCFLTGEAHYNDYHEVANQILLIVTGHYESEHYVKELFYSIISKKILNFKIYFSEKNTNPVNYM